MGEYRIALAGNPNTGKSTLFNALTGLNQHTGNWPGKTVVRAEGEYTRNRIRYQVIDLPGTYSLYSNSADEETARDYIIFEKPDATVVVLDATSMERNLNLALQVLEMTDRVIVCINLMDEANRLGISIKTDQLSLKLGVPVVAVSARNKLGLEHLMDEIEQLVRGITATRPYQVPYHEDIERRIKEMEPLVIKTFGDWLPSRWLALRLLDNDQSFIAALERQLMKPDREVYSYDNVLPLRQGPFAERFD